MSSPSKIGTVAWTDLTVPDAQGLREFYERVVGWSSKGLSMGDYEDFTMFPPGADEPVAGVCHARGVNADLPSVWLIYIIVEDLKASLAACAEAGGETLMGPKSMGPESSYAIIRDPAGAVSALYEVGG